MVANPSIYSTAISATKDQFHTLIIALLSNSSRGMVQMRAYLSSSCVTEDTAMRTDLCVMQTTNPYFNLYDIAYAIKPSTTTATTACLRAAICSSGENCDTLACSVWDTGFQSEVNSISISNAFGVTPGLVSDLTLTPGDGSISVSWGDVGQTTSIFAYRVTLKQGSTILISGYVINQNIVISSLTNGTAYTIAVKATSFDGYSGLDTEKTATPSAPCVDPVCDISAV